ncbi:MAG: hypothetical protein H8E45_03790 [Proteobacteria bacterium]|nr:hypothetical protein [Pseudomonadota bacterium]
MMLISSRNLAALLLSVSLATGALATGARAAEPKTFFDHVESSWAVGQVHLSQPLIFRDGMLLAFPGQIEELVHSRQGKPRSILLVFEIRDVNGSVPFAAGDKVFGPISLLPRYTYWRDNLPQGPHHQIPGGRRYVFMGGDIDPAMVVARSYAAALKLDMPERAVSKISSLVAALDSSLDVIASDAARELTSYPVLERDLDKESQEALGAWLASGADIDRRTGLITALGARMVNKMAASLESLSTRDDDTGAASLLALDAMARPRTTALLLGLLDAKAESVRAFAAGSLGLRAGTDAAARKSALALLSSNQSAVVRSSAALGLGAAGETASLDGLQAMLMAGDEASRPAAKALASLGGEKAIAGLKEAITDGPNEAMVGGVLAIIELDECSDCMEFLLGQHENHPEKAIRDLVGVLLEIDQGGHGHDEDQSTFH